MHFGEEPITEDVINRSYLVSYQLDLGAGLMTGNDPLYGGLGGEFT